ncbi:hypothetical protein ACGF5S_32595 [Nocardia nova]|uniref:hypothetical protein n=1 Tax=Nocardia nova TaxID=37330 RepID=UPI0037142D25
MTSRKAGVRRVATVAAIAAVAAIGLSACTSSPAEQADRERKAASVQVFRLHMTKDLWDRTHTGNNHSVDKPLRMTDEANGTVAIDLTGPQLVDYLQALDYNAHGGIGATDAPLAKSVYDAVAPVVDRIQTNPAPNAPIPEVTIDAAAGPSTPTTTSAPAAPQAK